MYTTKPETGDDSIEEDLINTLNELDDGDNKDEIIEEFYNHNVKKYNLLKPMQIYAAYS